MTHSKDEILIKTLLGNAFKSFEDCECYYDKVGTAEAYISVMKVKLRFFSPLNEETIKDTQKTLERVTGRKVKGWQVICDGWRDSNHKYLDLVLNVGSDSLSETVKKETA